MMIVSLGHTTPNLKSIFAGISQGRIRVSLSSPFSDIGPDDIHEAINYAIKTVGMIVTPPAGAPWNVDQKLFDRMIDLTLQRLAQIDPASAGTISRYDMGVYIIGRGYKASLPPIDVQPIPEPKPVFLPEPKPLYDPKGFIHPGLKTEPPVYVPPPIEREVIEPKPAPVPMPVPLPIDQPQPIGPPPQEYVGPPEDYPLIPDPGIDPIYDTTAQRRTGEGIDKNTIYWIVGAVVGGFILSGMGRDRYAY